MKGFFKPVNPKKYKGDPTNIVYRSSYELKLMDHLDKAPDVVKWNSEEIIVPYRSPLDGRLHRYFPDFYVEKLDADGKKKVFLIEVKPYKDTIPPKKQKKVTKSYLYEVKSWAINTSKWEAAIRFCNQRGWKFITMTERELGIKY